MATETETSAGTLAPQHVINEESALALVSSRNDPLAFLVDPTAFNHLWRVATGYSRSALVPQQFQGKPDDCFIMCQLAIRMKVDPFMLMQSSYVVHGRPGFEAKLAIALLNASGKIRGTIKTELSGSGDDYGCRAWCIDRESGEKVVGPKVDWKMVKAEGWQKDKGTQKSKWATMPDLMFVYRAASYMIRTNYPEVMMGVQTVEDIEDMVIDVQQQRVPSDVRPPSKADAVKAALQNNIADNPPFNPPTAEEEAAIKTDAAAAVAIGKPPAESAPESAEPSAAQVPQAETDAIRHFEIDVENAETREMLTKLEAAWKERSLGYSDFTRDVARRVVADRRRRLKSQSYRTVDV